MLEFCGRKFTCDECPICEGVEHRLRAAREGGYEPQLEYCGCDKVQTEFFISGYCSDAFEADKPQGKLCEPRKTGRAYRRKMRKQNCESGTNDFVPMNQTAEYSGIEMSVNRQGMLRVRVLDDDGGFTTQDIVEIRSCPLCGKRFVKG